VRTPIYRAECAHADQRAQDAALIGGQNVPMPTLDHYVNRASPLCTAGHMYHASPRWDRIVTFCMINRCAHGEPAPMIFS